MAYLTIPADAKPREFGVCDFEEGTSLTAGLREFLEKCAGGRRTQMEAKRKIIAASRESVSDSGREGHG